MPESSSPRHSPSRPMCTCRAVIAVVKRCTCWLRNSAGTPAARPRSHEANRKPVKALVTRRTNSGEHHHGTWVADPYRWLEDDADGEVRAWVQTQNERTAEFLAR